MNADLIAAGLAPFAPETQAIRAGRLVLTRIKELTAARRDFAVETTLTGRNYVRAIADWKTAGYQVVLFFLWLPTAETAVARVANRVKQGGHDIPEPSIRRRFEAGLGNFFGLYSTLVDSWELYDGSERTPTRIAVAQIGKLAVGQPLLFETIRSRWGIELMPEPEARSLSDLAAAAFRKASAQAVLRARQTGTPLIVWRDGRVQAISPDEAAELPPEEAGPQPG